MHLIRGNNLSMDNKRMVLLLALMCSAPVMAADKVYKWESEDGSVVFSDTPPPEMEKDQMDVHKIPPSNVISTPSQQQDLNQ